jgi:hypothetical protein
MSVSVLGIDIAKQKFDVILLADGKKQIIILVRYYYFSLKDWINKYLISIKKNPSKQTSFFLKLLFPETTFS